MKVRTKLTEAELPHPNDPTFVAIVRRLGKIEALTQLTALNDFREALPVKDPNNPGQFLIDSDGNTIIHVTANMPADKIIDQLESLFKGWRGLKLEAEDGTETEIPYSRENLKYVFEEDLAVHETKIVNGKETEVVTAYWQWVIRQIKGGEIFDPKSKR